jgi:hypothetical protein
MMRMRLSGFCQQIYGLLLQLYPDSYRVEFADEMQAVFAELLAQSEAQGRMAVWAMLFRELRQAPEALWHAHRHTNPSRKARPNS